MVFQTKYQIFQWISEQETAMSSCAFNWSKIISKMKDQSCAIPTDVTFEIVENGQLHEVKAHKMLLAMVSDIFETMFYSTYVGDKNANVIKIEKTTAAAFKIMKDAIYNAESFQDSLEGKSVDEVFDVVNLLERYQIKELMEAAKEYLANYPVTDDTVFEVAGDAMEYSNMFAAEAELLLLTCAKFLVPKLKATIFMGYNANCDSSKKGTEVGALVSSLDENFSKYSSTCFFSSSHEDIIKRMAPAVAKALRGYREANNGKLPVRIIMYRDSLGEEQIEYAKDREIEAIKKVFKKIGVPEMKLTFIVVSKRINIRFFQSFFLISQSVRQGTVNPTSYNVIEDNSGLKPDHIQKLTYKLTHLYCNWSGIVRVPAPCQDAHKLAFLVGQSLHKNPAEELENQLYYL